MDDAEKVHVFFNFDELVKQMRFGRFGRLLSLGCRELIFTNFNIQSICDSELGLADFGYISQA